MRFAVRSLGVVAVLAVVAGLWMFAGLRGPLPLVRNEGSYWLAVTPTSPLLTPAMRVALASNAAPSLGRSVGNDVHVEADRGGDLAEIMREMVEDFFAGHSEPPIRTGASDARGRLALVQ